MTTAGPNSGATFASDSSVGTIPWSNPGNAAASDDSRATASFSGASQSEYLKATNFGFSIPSGATINGITVEIEKSASTINRVSDAAVRIVKGGAIGSTDKSAAPTWGGSDAYTTYGGAADLWGESWAYSDINNSGFGVAISGSVATGTPQGRVDHIRITIDYTEGGGSVEGSLTVTLDDITLVATGVSGEITGALDVTLDDITLSAAGTVGSDIEGSLNVTLDDITLVGSGAVGSISGSLNATLDDITLVGSGTLGVSTPVPAITSGPLPLALQLHESPGGALIADFSDATACEIDSGSHGFRSLTCFVNLPVELAFSYAAQARGKWLSLNYGCGVVWEGRVEDPTVVIAGRGSGLQLVAFGAWQSLYDVPYTALWSASGTAGWRVVTSDDSAARLPERFEMDNNNRIYVGLKKNTVYATGDQGSWVFQPPHENSRNIVSVTFDYAFNASSTYSARLIGINEGFTGGAAEWTLAGTGSLQTGSRRIVLSAAKDMVVFEILVNSPGATYSGETGASFLKITSIRVVTSVANEVNTTFTANTSTGTQTVPVGTTAGMYVGQSLIIAQGGTNRERVVVEAVDSATSFTTTFAFTHSSGHAVEADVVYADEIVSDLVSHVTAVNPDALSDSTALIESPGLDLLDEVYEDAWPGDIATKLAGLGDDQVPPRLWEVGVWEGQRLHFRPKGSDGQVWAVDANELEVNSSLNELQNSAYGVYQDANSRLLRTAVSDDASSQARYGITRRTFVGADTTSEAQAEKHRDAQLHDGKTVKPRSELQPDYLMDKTGAIAPKWLIRAGQTLNLRNLPPTLASEVDRIRTFLLAETGYDLMTDVVRPVPEVPPASLEVLVARQSEGF